MTDYTTLITDALRNFDSASARTIQSTQGMLGPSDIGFCRQKAVLTTRQVKPTDHPPMWAANVGTAIHTYVEKALQDTYPKWLMGSTHRVKVTATLPSGAVIQGTPDIIIPQTNTVLDIKTVNGFEWTKRHGPSQSHLYQRHLYAMGCIAYGLFDDTKPIYVGNVYFDRSGKIPYPLIYVEEFDPSLTSQIDSWVSDVIYAVTHNEDSARDVAAAVCEQICSFFTVCRGQLASREDDEITDTTLISAVEMYVEGRDLASTGAKMKEEARDQITGINGFTPKHQVRWVGVGGSMRLDVRDRHV